ncbi:hypothetical protein HMPREF9603_00651 [Cutibacterium acnes HL001PA1]|nr:hypothetical protein HMPREF9603_00651 [Cutibacterium acnes HL001PA1]EFT10181.1 hypothetical protein HMPREF9619_01386 [Cutibacterium acnes HL082PA2]EGE69810.1 hypothetical protein HMPREF9341_01093 [Cutibacterium acnes HL103PA1]
MREPVTGWATTHPLLPPLADGLHWVDLLTGFIFTTQIRHF